MPTPIPWQQAWQQALYGPAGFYRAADGVPADHFRTSVHASTLFAGALARLAAEVDADLGWPAGFTVLDVGAGRGELLAALAATVPRRWRLVAVDLRPRPDALPDRVVWTGRPPDRMAGLVVAHEWLDDLSCPVVRRVGAGPARLVLVDPATGAERDGPPPAPADVAWLDRFWPLPPDGRAEVGHPRDAAWADLVGRLDAGLALAVDYDHPRHARPVDGTLTGFRAGREVPPVPDGTCDITAHVALDACAVAGAAAFAGAAPTVVLRQRAALHALGVDGRPPVPLDLARSDPAGYLAALSRRSQAAELTAADGLGAFGWLAQPVGCPLPGSLREASADPNAQ